MGEARRRSSAPQQDRAAVLRASFEQLGIAPDQFGFYDSPAFLAAERGNPEMLDAYAEWVLRRPRSPEYDNHVRNVVPKLADIIDRRIGAEGWLRQCGGTSGAICRMLDRLGVWSFMVRGSANVSNISRPEMGARYWWDIDRIDEPNGMTGHMWVCAPPFMVVDVSLKHQPWGEDNFGVLLPGPILLDTPTRISPEVDDVVCGEVRALHARREGRLDPGLHFRLNRRLSRFVDTFGAWQADVGGARVRYVPNATSATDLPLEDLEHATAKSIRPIDIWNNEVAPVFGVSERPASLIV